MYSSRLVKPKVSDVKQWHHDQELSNKNADVYVSDIDFAFYKVTARNQRPRYFYGETAWQDAARYARDQYNPHI
jgi:hypothetical protein